jgi:hypothetical protein
MNNCYLGKVCLLPDAIAELFAEVVQKGQITFTDCYGLMTALFNSSLTEDERHTIHRMLRSVDKGRLKVVDKHERNLRL